VLKNLWNRLCRGLGKNLNEDKWIEVRISKAVCEEISHTAIIAEPHQDPMAKEPLVVMGLYVGQA